MKKFLVMLLAGAMAMSLFACGKKESGVDVIDDQDIIEEMPQLAGGFTTYMDNEEAKLPAEVKEAFDKAMEGYTGAGFKVIGFLGTQVVSGTNYAFLCEKTLVTADPVSSISVVKVYVDLEGKAEVLDVKEIDFSAFTPSEETEGEDAQAVTGGWEYSEAAGCGIKDTCKEAFDKAMEGMTGVGYEPIACLGTQVVAGTNYAVLCRSTVVTADPVTNLSVVTVYAGVDGTTEVINIAPFVVE